MFLDYEPKPLAARNALAARLRRCGEVTFFSISLERTGLALLFLFQSRTLVVTRRRPWSSWKSASSSSRSWYWS
jgi:hypothetical protein